MFAKREKAVDRYGDVAASCTEGTARLCERPDALISRPDLRLTLTVDGNEVAVYGFGAGALTDLAGVAADHGEAAARDAALALAQTLARLAGKVATFRDLE